MVYANKPQALVHRDDVGIACHGSQGVTQSMPSIVEVVMKVIRFDRLSSLQSVLNLNPFQL